MNKRLILWATLCIGAACSKQIEGSQYYPEGPCDGLDCTVTCDDEDCWSVSDTAPKADTDVQCDAILDHPDWELCDQTPSTCVSVFYDSAGCTAVCEAVGLVCSEVRENLDGTCAPNDERPPLSCSESSGHQSDWCLCIDPNECVPDCTDRECGDDGCGGTCGECTGTETCELGECLDQDPPRDERALLTERVGYGSKTTGGLDGTTCHVTNRNDSGAGSLRACTQTSGARWIVFDIDGAVYLKSNIQVPSNTTIDGRGRTVRIQGSGLNLSGVSNVLLVNLIFERGNGGDDNDAITIRNGTHNVWVHHCSFSDYGDGLIDIKEAATDITVSWSYFTNHDKVMLISASTKDTQDDVIRVTLHHNWFKDTKQRHPRLRFGRVCVQQLLRCMGFVWHRLQLQRRVSV